MPPSKRASSSHSSSRRSSPSRRASSSHSSSRRSSPSRRATSSHSSHSSYSSSSSYRSSSSSYSHRSGHHSYGSSSGGLLGALFGLNRVNDSEPVSYSSAPGTNIPTLQREYLCKYCDTKSVLTRNGGEALVCPICGAPVSQTDLDAIHDDAYEELAAYRASTLPSGSSSRKKSSSSVAVLFVVLIIIMAYIMLPNRDSSRSGSDTGDISVNTVEDSVYVPALLRSVDWHDEYGSYYDEQTDCYFLLNTDMKPEIWQYWYEGISSDYGEYGWMEWNEKENKWYINTSEDDWVPLPEKYDTNRLWHM